MLTRKRINSREFNINTIDWSCWLEMTTIILVFPIYIHWSVCLYYNCNRNCNNDNNNNSVQFETWMFSTRQRFVCSKISRLQSKHQKQHQHQCNSKPIRVTYLIIMKIIGGHCLKLSKFSSTLTRRTVFGAAAAATFDNIFAAEKILLNAKSIIFLEKNSFNVVLACQLNGSCKEETNTSTFCCLL